MAIGAAAGLAVLGLPVFRVGQGGEAVDALPARRITLPPSPPSPPSGPPRGTNFSRRKLTQPSPPLPASTRISTSSTNMILYPVPINDGRFFRRAGPIAGALIDLLFEGVQIAAELDRAAALGLQAGEQSRGRRRRLPIDDQPVDFAAQTAAQPPGQGANKQTSTTAAAKNPPSDKNPIPTPATEWRPARNRKKSFLPGGTIGRRSSRKTAVRNSRV